MKTSFCGSGINYQYCKCAFHNQYCDAVGLSPSTAHAYVLLEFQDWNRDRIQRFGEQCIDRNGHWNKSRWECTTCTRGDIFEGSLCVEPDKIVEDSSEVKGCKKALENIKTDWIKYSDFDTRLGGDVSYEVQQFNENFNQVADLISLYC